MEGRGEAEDTTRAVPISACRHDVGTGVCSTPTRHEGADSSRTMPAKVQSSGLATTMRMAARPSNHLQRSAAAPFVSRAFTSISDARGSNASGRSQPRSRPALTKRPAMSTIQGSRCRRMSSVRLCGRSLSSRRHRASFRDHGLAGIHGPRIAHTLVLQPRPVRVSDVRFVKPVVLSSLILLNDRRHTGDVFV